MHRKKERKKICLHNKHIVVKTKAVISKMAVFIDICFGNNQCTQQPIPRMYLFSHKYPWN